MKRSIKLLFFLSLFSVRALSQEAAVTFLFSSIAPCGNSTACVDVTTDDFSNVLYVKMPIKWDPKIVKLKSIQPVIISSNTNLYTTNTATVNLAGTLLPNLNLTSSNINYNHQSLNNK